MKISYAITVCNEFFEIKNLIDFLLTHKDKEDEIVVLYDNGGTKEVLNYLHSVESIKLFRDNFDSHFANWKNKLNSLCKGEYIFQIDADELPSKNLIEKLPNILEKNKTTDLFFVPRINIVEGITDEEISLWNWKKEKNIINWPDYQSRIYKNKSDIFWKNKVHEIIEGHSFFTFLPKEEKFSLLHIKTLEKQKQQNELYLRLQ